MKSQNILFGAMAVILISCFTIVDPQAAFAAEKPEGLVGRWDLRRTMTGPHWLLTTGKMLLSNNVTSRKVLIVFLVLDSALSEQKISRFVLTMPQESRSYQAQHHKCVGIGQGSRHIFLTGSR
ncbi:MAG: hypothetical protein ACYS6K_03365 [Planctomycetota bacterium]|jgi:hypothetical protein